MLAASAFTIALAWSGVVTSDEISCAASFCPGAFWQKARLTSEGAWVTRRKFT